MENARKLSDTEFDVMMVLWAYGRPATSNEIMQKINKAWRVPTLLKIIARMAQKGYVGSLPNAGKRGYLYEALVPKREYIEKITRDFFVRAHGGSLLSLLDSLPQDGLSQEEADQLDALLHGMDNKA